MATVTGDSATASRLAALAVQGSRSYAGWRIQRSVIRADKDEAAALVRLAEQPEAAEATRTGLARLSKRSSVGSPPDALAPTLERAVAQIDDEVVVARERTAISRMAYVPGTATKVDLPVRSERRSVLHAQDITVQFGGLTAVDTANLEVREGEIVGLIGPNGAGKTTLFNAISGLNTPTSGSVALFGADVTNLPVHQRAAAGMGRTFQLIQLFPELSVTDNLLVGTHVRNSSGFGSHLFATGRAIEGEQAARRRVAQVVELLGLGDVAGQPVTGLPFGVLRLVEVARALVTGAPYIMLDEPASGLDNAETDKLSDLLLWVRQTLGISLLLIEHDVRMVTALCDYIYVLDRGKMIADGEAADIRRDPVVTAAYFGVVENTDTDGDGDAEPAADGPVAKGPVAKVARPRRTTAKKPAAKHLREQPGASAKSDAVRTAPKTGVR